MSSYLVVTGLLAPDGQLTLTPMFMADEPGYAGEDPESTLLAELVDVRGNVLLRHRLNVSPVCTDEPTGAGDSVMAKIPFPDATRLVRFIRDGQIIHEVEVPAEKPVVRLAWDPAQNVEGQQIVSWAGTHPEDRRLRYILCYSHEGQSGGRV